MATLHRHAREATVVVLALAVPLLLLTSAPPLVVPARVHDVVLRSHLAALALGFGAVLAVDWHGLLWLLRRIELGELLTVTTRLTTPIWLGLAGLVTTGALLDPDTGSTLTRLKIALVALVAVNGLHASAVHRALSARRGSAVPRRLLVRALAVGGLSQLGWWGATVIGLLNSR